MRTYERIIEDYVKWYYKKTGDAAYDYRVFYDDVDEHKLSVRKAAAWQKILDLCYSIDSGIYWFHKFILSDI